MNKKLQVFVSSTYTDLQEERQAAVQAILDAGHIPAGMELFKAGNESQLKTICKWIDESDVYLLILGGRYGSIESKSSKSYTQLEYEYALSKDIPVFAVVLSQSFLTNKINTLGLDKVMEQIAPDKYQLFKSLVMSKIIREVDDYKDIQIAIHSTLNEFMNSYNMVGWIRPNSLPITSQHQSVDFKSLYNNLNQFIIFYNGGKNFNANEFFVKNIKFFQIGVSDTYKGTIYHRYTKIYIFNDLLEYTKDENGMNMAQLTKLGYEYYNYLIHKKEDNVLSQ